ncbi:DNA-directed RNA polymerase subunit omega [Ferroacidibacillus organovorans]|uniref:DNA-directed RNA polymerase subunit omega n=1 Tax=Ferroacidibacillus organovorans TaxID=1765683 RepID=A0A162SEV3_9BACL|nr:DNA-directed RNA polymerase subunit omega [Ferroacidibacillus organovorans]KYP79763.1 DNA-directed RNA polymerase subunit omega [Ferroacidibacillus organovorans]OAG92191.1 DNA-directed RNA polymerase subunit omega [Ferroacidibacillus organovorans]OPG16260.1 DNA-directed RNA polymerase subunit omega [Ferroacidibacillus organovorans]
MLYPSVDKLLTLADSKYTLVIAASKRARALQEGAEPRAIVRSGRFVSTALREIEIKQISYVRTRDGLK